eukprot:9574929-Alexandrium_andersonii.AAC.1
MSASLVGSEMCIRDSHSPKFPELSRRLPGGSPAAPRRLSGSTPRNKLQPVSYTHLTLPTICSV